MSLLLIVLFALLSGCATTGNPSAAESEKISKIAPGTSTKADVFRILGNPTSSSERTRIIEVWNYDYVTVGISPVTLLPLIGPFLGSSSFERGAVTITFDEIGSAQSLNLISAVQPQQSSKN